MRLFCLGAACAALLAAQAPRTNPIPTAPWKDEPPVERKHELTLAGKTLRYTSTTGTLPIRNETGEVEASIFFIAYQAESTAPRPLIFSFNGGPGSSSVWLHLGALGPKRIRMNDDGSLPPAPYRMEPNAHTWLAHADLVFIDPVGTGYSRATKPEYARKYNSFTGDIDCVAEFIRLWLARYQRWNSPLYLAGESYGTTRAAGLAGKLVDQGIALNGIVLISSVLNFQTLRFGKGNDLPYVLYLPTYTATAWYHKKLPGDLRKLLDESRRFAETDYLLALQKGDRLTAAERSAVADKLARLTGLSKRYVEQNDLRIEIMRFIKELRREEGVTVGRLDSRLTATEGLNGAETPQFDPSNSAIRPPYTAAFNQYVRSELGY
ncbi:MAG: hypothetical protein MUC42_00815, partial [Bryobacter sp.]|nr:hypothetical protein [Bryobacter sp.]